MKHSILLCFFLLFAFAFNANGQFRASILAGPKISYTQNIGTGVHTNVGKGGYQLGVNFGYNFTKPAIIVETGLNFAKYDIIFDYNQIIGYSHIKDETGRAFHYKSYTAFQIPLRVKVNVLPVDSRYIIRPTFGLSLALRNNHDALLPEEPFKLQADNKGFYHIHDGYQERLFFFPMYGQYEINTLMCFEGGIEIGYKLSPKIEVLGALSYQNGFKIMDSHVVHVQQDYSDKDINNVYATTASSRLESLNFNFGVAYTFKKK